MEKPKKLELLDLDSTQVPAYKGFGKLFNGQREAYNSLLDYISDLEERHEAALEYLTDLCSHEFGRQNEMARALKEILKGE